MQNITLTYGAEKPQAVTVEKKLGQKRYTVNFDIEETNVAGYSYRWHSITLELGIWHYAAIVSAIINAAYPADKMQAIQNNYLNILERSDIDEDKQQEYRDEFAEMCDARNHAKAIANQLLAYATENNL